MTWHSVKLLVIVAAVGSPAVALRAEERTETFDVDPGWEGVNNRSTAFEKKKIEQNFGYSSTHHAGGKAAGEIGGLVNPAAEPAYYARKISKSTLDNKLSASGTLAATGQRAFHLLIGFFNANTINEWRTPNTIAVRLLGRGEVFFAYVEYCTSRWRAGGDNPGGFATVPGENSRPQLRGFQASGKVHHWSLSYDPAAQNGNGSIVVTIDNETAVCHLDAGHKHDGATFDHFGLLPVLKQWDDPGEVWLDDVTVNGEHEDFSTDPGWDSLNNRRAYTTAIVRPRFDFGFSDTAFAGGRQRGELGGLVFRGDIRFPERMASYGAPTEPLTLAKPLRASGTVALCRAVSDSTTLLGFYHARESLRTNPSQATGWPRSFVGLAIEGPSRAGFFVYPAYRDAGDTADAARGEDLPSILPNGTVHRWTIDYIPRAGALAARITVTLDGKPARLELPDGVTPTELNRFGLVSTWIDGNGQHVYFDDVTYTWKQ